MKVDNSLPSHCMNEECETITRNRMWCSFCCINVCENCWKQHQHPYSSRMPQTARFVVENWDTWKEQDIVAENVRIIKSIMGGSDA